MQSDNQIDAAFLTLWSDVQSESNFPTERPLLAHYTSIATLECILRNEEVWFSNPLNMNDFEELRFGVIESAHAFRNHEGVKAACKTPSNYELLSELFDKKFKQFDLEGAFDLYAFCMANHDDKHDDGVLSMWRGYDENGGGAALVLDISKLKVWPGSPIILSAVHYLSRDERLQWIKNKLDEFASLLQINNPCESQLETAVHYLFERIISFALCTKHHGFKEEKEWRAVYMRSRDVSKHYVDMISYAISKRGIEPKFKYKVKPIGSELRVRSFNHAFFVLIYGA